jgi:membrane protein involved in colicin uptake
MPSLPPGAPADQPMLLQMIIDPDGTMQSVTYIGGPMELLAAATDAVKRWKSDPARINGVPTAAGVLLQVKFAPPAKD